MARGKRLTWPNRDSTDATMRSRTSSDFMPWVVATQAIASRSQQSRELAIVAGQFEASEHQRRFERSTAILPS